MRNAWLRRSRRLPVRLAVIALLAGSGVGAWAIVTEVSLVEKLHGGALQHTDQAALMKMRNRDAYNNAFTAGDAIFSDLFNAVDGAGANVGNGARFTRFPRPDFALSLHDDDTMPAGTIGYHPGPFRAMSDGVTIVVHGRGGHAAMPMNTVDPVVLAARIVIGLQTIVSRENNPVDPVVITVGSIHGGTQANVIPDEVRLQLSVRTYTPEVRRKTLAAIRRVARGEAISAGAPREPEVITPGENATEAVVYNDPALTARLAAALKAGLGEKTVVEMPAKMTSEDFAQYWVTGKVPSALLHIGAVNAAKFTEIQKTGVPGPAPHSPEWAPDREPTLKAAIRAEVTELLALFKAQ